MKNFYEVLEVEPNADFDAIKNAYIKLIKLYHPDVFEGDKNFAEQKTAELTEAYNVLKDEKLRREYDLKNNLQSSKIYEQNTSDKFENINEEKTKENVFKEFAGGIKNFFKGLKTDLSNFGKNIKINKKQNVNHKIRNKNKQNQETDNFLEDKNNDKKLPIIILSLIIVVIILIILIIYVV